MPTRLAFPLCGYSQAPLMILSLNTPVSTLPSPLQDKEAMVMRVGVS